MESSAAGVQPPFILDLIKSTGLEARWLENKAWGSVWGLYSPTGLQLCKVHGSASGRLVAGIEHMHMNDWQGLSPAERERRRVEDRWAEKMAEAQTAVETGQLVGFFNMQGVTDGTPEA